MTANVFIDSNIYLYALAKPTNPSDESKRAMALLLLKTLLETQTLLISTQVLNEVHSKLIKKFKFDDETVFEIIEQTIVSVTLIKPISYQTYHAAFQLRTKYKFSYWDSLIVASSLENDCHTLYSEDMQHGLKVENKLSIINPFQI